MKNALALAALSVVALAGLASNAHAVNAYGITGAAAGGSLFRFDPTNPSAQTNIGSFTGLPAGQSIRAIDFRPADSKLYAVATVSGTLAQLYTVNLQTAALTAVGTGFNFTTNPGSRVSIDFNPVVDRLRVVDGSSTQNLRVNPNTGALVQADGNLAFDPADPFVADVSPFASDIAYSNNVVGATTTTLYAWDYNEDNLITIGSVGGSPVSPNTGTSFTVGGPPSFITNSAGNGLDIDQTGTAYFSYDNTANVETLATINLATGAVTNVGTFTPTDVLDIAIAVPEPVSVGTLALACLMVARRRRA